MSRPLTETRRPGTRGSAASQSRQKDADALTDDGHDTERGEKAGVDPLGAQQPQAAVHTDVYRFRCLRDPAGHHAHRLANGFPKHWRYRAQLFAALPFPEHHDLRVVGERRWREQQGVDEGKCACERGDSQRERERAEEKQGGRPS
jgi:hypothetical protein